MPVPRDVISPTLGKHFDTCQTETLRTFLYGNVRKDKLPHGFPEKGSNKLDNAAVSYFPHGEGYVEWYQKLDSYFGPHESLPH